MNDETQNSLRRLQLLEQNLQAYAVQKQGVTSQLAEAESAISGLGNTETAYRIIGEIMVAVDKDELKKEMENTLNSLKRRLEIIEKQEKRLREEAEKLQKKIMEGVKKK